MTNRYYVTYINGGMNKGFAPFLPYKASNGIGFIPTKLSYPNQDTVLYFSTSHGVIHPDCGVNWNEPEDSPNRLTKAIKYAPLSANTWGSCTFDEYGTEALEKIAKMVAGVHKEMAHNLLVGLETVTQ